MNGIRMLGSVSSGVLAGHLIMQAAIEPSWYAAGLAAAVTALGCERLYTIHRAEREMLDGFSASVRRAMQKAGL